MEKMKWIKKGISALLALNMVLSSVPLPAFAATTDNLCEHHTEHTAECGYREGSAGSACTHEHSEDCYAILECLHTCGEECADGCNHECTVDNGCVRLELDCHHVHGDCGYSEGTAEVPCGHVHNESCGYVEAVAGNPCANAETDPECDHSGDCGFVAAVEGQPCGHTACDDTCGYTPATEGTPCTHTHAVKVDSADSCYKLLCSHADGGHDDACGYAQAVEAHDCHYECAECAASEESSEPAPVCYCVEKCTAESFNEYCDVCGFGYAACAGGTDEGVTYADVAQITGVSIHLDGDTTINSGHITVTSENSIFLIVNGTNLENLSEEYYFDIPYTPVYMKSAGSLSDDGTIDIYLPPEWLEGLSEYPIVYVTDDGTRVETGIYLTYDDGTGGEEDTTPAQITGVSITVDGVTYTEGNVTITPDTQSIIVTATGTNFANASNDNYVQYADGAGGILSSGYWTIDTAANTATLDLSANISWFDSCDNFEIQYCNDLQSLESWQNTGIFLTYYDDITVTIDTGASVTLRDADRDDYYEISTADELYAFAAAVNGGDNAINGELTANIVVNEGTMTAETTGARAWTPIGNDTYAYLGTFDGGGHTISGLYFNDSTAYYVGLFGCLESGSTVKNVRITDSYICATYAVGGVAGRVFGGTVENCSNAGTVSGTGNHVGGVAGNSDGTVTGCSNAGTVSGTGNHVGGVAGNSHGTVTGCSNVGTVSGTNYVGGVVGNSHGTMTGCYNTGAVSGYDLVGGVAGNSHGTMTGCYNTGTVSGTGSYVGGVVGDNMGTVASCYYLDTAADGGIKGGDVAGQAEAKTADQFKSGEVAYLLGSPFGQDIGTDASPNFTGGTVYRVGVTCTEGAEAYANTQSDLDHNYTDGICTACGEVCDHSGSTTKPTDNGNGTHSVTCTVCGTAATEEHSGGTATCTEQAKCKHCGASYGELGGHSPAENTDYTDNGDGTHSYTCTDCKETVAEDHTGGTATCTTQAKCEHCGASYGEVDTTNHDSTVAFGSNGFCPNGCYEPAADSNADGVYEIANAGQLYWFAAQVNSGEKSINAVLMNDIDLTNHIWTPIGVTAMGEGVTDGYTGTFDGQGHVISNITFAAPASAMAAGIFGTVQSGGTVKNLGVENLTFDNNDYDHRAGGIAGQLLAGSTISDCYVINSTVKASSRVVGGIVGMNRGTVKNCYTCNVTLAGYSNRFGGISGDYSGGKLENCYTDYSALASSEAGTTTNCEAGVSAERFASGEVAYLLGDPWGQTIGTDPYPVLYGAEVYRFDTCKNEREYSNTYKKDGHQYENGICTVCGGYEPATDSDSDGYYEITNAGQLYWFAQQVNSGSTAINGELTADIVVNENVLTADGALNGDGSAFRVWTPIGTEDNAYTGEFRGSEHTVSGLYFNSRSADYVGLFGYVGSGGTVENVGVIDSYFYAGSYVGGVAGCNRGTLQSVYNTGNVNGSKYAGGVVGENNYIVQYAYNTGTVFAMDYAGGVTGYNNYILQYAYNTGFAGGAAYYGGIAGDNRHTLKDCYYLADSETDSFDGTTAKTAGQFEIGEVAYLLNGDQSTIVFKQTLGEDGDAAPNFTGGTVYQVTNCKSEVAYSNTNEDIGHIGGTATCTELAVCTVCGESYGEVSSHTPDAAGYTDNGDGTHSYTCTVCGTVTEDHTGGTATSCTTQANCEYCGASYGEVDTTNHDETVAFDSNGFCTNGCYEPAVLNGEVYEISNAGQLYWFAQQVNNGETTISAILMNDIVINSQVLDADGNLISDTSGLRQWTPIGHYNSDTDNLGFAGTFDGNGKTISGLYHYGDTARYAGLFGYSAGTIRDLTIADTYIHTTHSDGRAGSVTGLNEGTVSNCSNYGIVVGGNQVGGIIGRIIAGLVENCTNYGTVNSTTHAGGICGCASGGTINNCYNTGSVKADSSVGGIAGSMQDTSNISNCISVGTVEGSSQAGGVVGYVLNHSTTNATITNCYHDNTVCGYAPVGVNGGSYASATLTKVEGKTTEAFASGEITWLLNGESAEGIWKQTIGTDTYPGFTGGTVYHSSCGGGVPYSNDAEETKEHNIGEDFRCVNTLLSGGICNAYERASQNADGYYEIYNASQLYWFAEQVNGGEKSINAVLMNDIDLTNHTWTPIGVTAMGESVTDGYTGTFDGQGHVISNVTFAAPASAMAAGIFGTVQSGGTVKNLGVENLTFDNNDYDHRAAGIAGQLLADSTISDCFVINSTVKASSRVVGGIVGMNKGTVKNCYTCNMTLAGYNNRFGGISGDYSGGKLENCYTDYSALASSEAGTTTNCEAGVSAERFASGEIAYALGNGWGQTIGTDGCPVFGGATVYQVAKTGCSAQGEYAYSNVNEAVVIPHEYTNGFCACGGYEEAVQNADGYYVIDNGGKLFWFAELVNGGNNTSNAVLTADIDLENRNWTPIGTQNESVSPNVKVPYMGVFDGQCHVIKNLSIHVTDGREAGLFGRAQDATLSNFGVVDVAVVSDPVNGTGYRAGIVAGELHRCTVANVYSAGNLTVTTTHAQAGGIAGECADSTLTNCFTTYGCLTASNADAVTNCYYLAESENTGSCGDYKTADQFASGEVAWLLNGSTDQGDLVWYQNIGMDAYPKFVGCVVNYNTESDTYHNGNTVNVSISWTEMSFTYTDGEWDPETHTYTGSWTADDGAAQITVKNVGAANVPVRFTFAGTMGEVTGQFDVEKAALTPGRAVTTTLTVSGGPRKSGFVDEQIGTVTVSLGSSGWAAGDSVTFYAKNGKAYETTVGEVSDSKMVLIGDTVNKATYTMDKWNDNTVRNLVISVGARYPSPEEATAEYYRARTDEFVCNNSSGNATVRYAAVYSYSTNDGKILYRLGYIDDTSWKLNQRSYFPSYSDRTVYLYYCYIWDVEFAE
ncbi:MAG: hypothetical protein IJZ39_04915 [Oscillospiraceae bacterium]|nr:hypothetical protein [Oscillospiraceae bacterium]